MCRRIRDIGECGSVHGYAEAWRYGAGDEFGARRHLTHGHPLNFSGRMYKFVAYGVRQEDERIDYEEIEKLAHEHKPRMIVAGASAYSRVIDFERIGKVAKAGGRAVFCGHGAHRGIGGGGSTS